MTNYGALLEQQQREFEAMRVHLIGRGIDASGFSYDECKRWMRKLRDGALFVRPLSSYETKEVKWLRKPFFQGAAFHLLAGKKGQCKGTFLAGLAARVTTAKMYEEPRRVLVVTSEDSVELDFRPRFLAADGNDALVHLVNGDFRMPRDLAWLQETARELGDVGLIVIDPIGNHLSDTNTDGEGSVRNAIAPLNRVSDELDCMVFGVRHLGKDAGRGALSSVLGSTAWVDVPRCVIVMAQDDVDEMVFHVQVVAGNRAPRNAGLACRLQIVDVDGARDVTLLDGIGESEKDVNDLLVSTGAPKRDACSRVILAELAKGPQGMAHLKTVCAAECGASGETAYQAANKLKLEGKVRCSNSGFGTSWMWSLTTQYSDCETTKSDGELGRLPGDFGVAA